MITLFDITSEYKRIAEELIESGGEVSPELEERLQLTQNNLQEKAVNYSYIIKQSEYEVDIIDAEIERLMKMKKSRQKAVENLKERLSDAMQHFGIDEIKSPTMKLSFRKSETIEITDEKLIPVKFLIEQPAKVSKSAIKDAIKSGESVNGAFVQINYNLQIK